MKVMSGAWLALRRRPGSRSWQAGGPRRARSVKSYLRRTRITGILALLAVVGGVISDVTSNTFWTQHALLAGLASGVIVVALSIAVVAEVLARRRRRRWSVLAQYVMFELVRNARMIWSGVLEAAGLFSTTAYQQESIDAGATLVRDTPGLTAALRGVLDDTDGRGHLHTEIVFLAEHSDEVLGRWAAVMLNAEEYAEVLDRHVELVGQITWIASMLDSSDPPDDARRQRRARSSPAIQIQRELSSEWLADRIVVMTQLAEALDRGTLELALRVVPVQWWDARLGI
jgi:hypothetical protein